MPLLTKKDIEKASPYSFHDHRNIDWTNGARHARYFYEEKIKELEDQKQMFQEIAQENAKEIVELELRNKELENKTTVLEADTVIENYRKYELKIQQLKKLLEGFLWYAKIHKVEGVRYPQGSHEDFIIKAEQALKKIK